MRTMDRAKSSWGARGGDKVWSVQKKFARSPGDAGEDWLHPGFDSARPVGALDAVVV